jgi:hypothetical protein
MSILTDLKDKLEQEIVQQSQTNRLLRDLEKQTGLDDNNRAWEEAHDKYPRQIELLSHLIQNYITAGNEALLVFSKAVMFMPESVRELAFDRLIASGAVNTLATVDQINEVLKAEAK